MAGPLEKRHCCLLRRGWQMGNRDSCVCVCVGECFGEMGGWVVLGGGSTSQARLQSYWHAESHIWWAENSVHRHAEVRVFQRASDSRLHRGRDPENTDFTAHRPRLPLPSFSRNPVPIYLIRASTLLSGRQLIFAGAQEGRQCHRGIRWELANLLVWK